MPTLNQVNLIGFDLDGTLINSANGIYESYVYAVTKLGINAKSKNVVIKKIGPPIEKFFFNLHPEKDKKIEDYEYLFKKHYLRAGYKKTELKKNADALLKLINERQINIFLLTNKSKSSTEKILRLLEIKEKFSDIICVNPNNSLLNNKENVLSEYKKKCIYKNQLMSYVGDTQEDLDAANKNNIFFVGLSDGYGKFKNAPKNSSTIYKNISELIEAEFPKMGN